MSMRHWMTASLCVLALAAATTADAAQRRDRDNNPPGPAGGRGTNWENPPGWKGGPGTSPDRRWYKHGGKRHQFAASRNGYYFSQNYGYWHPSHGLWNQARRCWLDLDNNPPGPVGGARHQLGKPAGLEGWSGRVARPLSPLPLRHGPHNTTAGTPGRFCLHRCRSGPCP